MLDKIKDIGHQASHAASDAAQAVASSVKDGVDSLVNTATTVTGAINEKAVRASTAQMCRILEIALEEMKDRPLAERPGTLTATVNFGVASLEMQVQLGAKAATDSEQV